MKKLFNLFKLFKQPIRFSDKIVFKISVILTIAIVPLYLLIKRPKSLKQAIFDVFPKTMLKNCLIEFNGVKFLARRGKSDILLLNELSEPWMKQYFKPKKGDIVIDVGAHVGKYALTAAKLVGDEGVVIAIEAHPENFLRLMNNISLNNFRNVMALNIAAFNEDNKLVTLYGFGDAGYSLKPSNKNRINLWTKRIDSIVENSHIKRVDWVKIDVEGAEVEVLEGMKTVIMKFSPNIFIEVHSENLKKVDGLLKHFKKKNLGGDDPNIPVIFYQKER